MKWIGDIDLTGSPVSSDMELPLGEAERDTFTAGIEDQKRHDFFSNSVFDLAGNDNSPFAEQTAAMHDNERVAWNNSLPHVRDLKLYVCMDAALRITLADFAYYRSTDNQLRSLLQLGQG